MYIDIPEGMVDDKRIQEIADELDRAVAKEGAKATFGSSGLLGNRQGLLRIAVETLQAAVFPLQEGREVTDRTLDYIWVDDPEDYDGVKLRIASKISRTETIVFPEKPKDSAFGKFKRGAIGFLVLLVFLFLLASTFVGCIDLISKVS